MAYLGDDQTMVRNEFGWDAGPISFDKWSRRKSDSSVVKQTAHKRAILRKASGREELRTPAFFPTCAIFRNVPTSPDVDIWGVIVKASRNGTD